MIYAEWSPRFMRCMHIGAERSLGKRQWPDALLVRAGKPIPVAFPIKKWAPARASAQNRTRFLSYKPASPARPRARRADAPGNGKEGPAVSGGPLGNPWWSLGGSNP